MSSAKSVKNWLKGKTVADFQSVDLKVPVAPEVNFYSESDHKPVIDISDWATRHIKEMKRTNAHLVAEMLWRVADKTPRGHQSQMGSYYDVHYSSTTEDHTVLVPRCIVGALILEFPGGMAAAKDIVRYQRNGAGLGSVMQFLPAPMRDPEVRTALTVAQNQNDMGVPWETIAWRFSSRVGYRRPAKRAA